MESLASHLGSSLLMMMDSSLLDWYGSLEPEPYFSSGWSWMTDCICSMLRLGKARVISINCLPMSETEARIAENSRMMNQSAHEVGAVLSWKNRKRQFIQSKDLALTSKPSSPFDPTPASSRAYRRFLSAQVQRQRRLRRAGRSLQPAPPNTQPFADETAERF